MPALVRLLLPYAILVPSQGRTGVHHAAIHDHLAVVKFLAEAGAKLDHPDEKGLTALHICRSTPVAATLLRYGANPWAENKDGLTPAAYLKKVDGARGVAAFIEDMF